MGPDETATRKQLVGTIRFLLSQIESQSAHMVSLVELLAERGVVSHEDVQAMVNDLAQSKEYQRMKQESDRFWADLRMHRDVRTLLRDTDASSEA